MRYVMLLVMLLGLGGLTACGPTMKSEHMKEIEAARLEKHKACVTDRKEAEKERMLALKDLTSEQTAMALIGDAMVRQAEALSGKPDSCSQGISAFEMERDIARSRNETIGNLGGTALRVGGAVGGAYVAADAIKSVAKTAGDKTEINGDSNSVTLEKTTSNSDIKASTGDESGGVTVSGPTTTGPDKHSETTTETVAPETPIATTATE